MPGARNHSGTREAPRRRRGLPVGTRAAAAAVAGLLATAPPGARWLLCWVINAPWLSETIQIAHVSRRWREGFCALDRGSTGRASASLGYAGGSTIFAWR